MRIRFYGCLLAVFALLSASQASAQQSATGSITGRITDKETQAPIAGATVEAVTAGNRSVGSAVTDADGQYRITAIPAGSYAVVVTMVGYQTARAPNVRVSGGQTSIAGAALTTEAFLLNPVVVSASKHAEKAIEAPAAVSVVPTREIAERPTTTPVDHLRSTPGVDVMTTGVQGTNVVVRGFNNIFSGALHTLTDYRMASVPSLKVNFMQFMPQNNDDYSRIEVVLGPGSALYGPNTANGVLHLITKSPLDEQGTTLSVAGGSFPGAANSTFNGTKNGNLFHATARTAQKFSDKFGVKVSGQYFKAKEFFYRSRTEDSVRALVRDNSGNLKSAAALRATGLFPTTSSDADVVARATRIGSRDFDINRFSGDVRADWRPNKDLQTVVSAGLTNDNSIELTGIGAGQAVDWKYSYAQVRANYKNWFAQTYLNMSDAGETFLLQNGAPITDQSKVWAAQLQHVARLGTHQTFTYGGDFISTNPITNRTINGTREENDNYTELGGYIQSETSLTKMWEVVLAGRVDKHSELDKAVFSPRAGLVFKPTPNQNFRATFNRAFSTPTSLNLFLDIDAGALGALGPFGFRAHAQAPGRAGILMHDANGNVQIRTPFGGNPTQLVTPTLASIYTYQVTAIGLAAQLPASLQTYMRSLVNDPTFGTSNAMILLDPLNGKALPFSNGAVADVAGIEESTSSTFEVGWKGLIGDKLMIAADAWTSKHHNFTSPLITATPLVLLSPTNLVQWLVPRLTPAILASNPAMGQAAAQAQATAIATNMAKLPGGIVSSSATTVPAPNLVLTYINFGDLTLQGADLSATALLSAKWQLAMTGSLVSDDYFKLPLGTKTGDSTVVALNAPKKKGSATLTYRDLQSGWNGQVRARFQAEFPANSAGYVGLACVKSAPANSGPCVQAFTLFDADVGYRLPFTGASVQLSVTNLTNKAYQSFIGTPPIRRMAILRLKYDM